MVMIAGDNSQIVPRRADPVTWPEVQVLKFVHGEESVFDVEVVGSIERSPQEELQRLRLIYGDEPVKNLFPLARLMETEVPGYREPYKAPPGGTPLPERE